VDFTVNDPVLEAFAVARKVSIDRVRSVVALPPSPRFDRAVRVLDEFAYRMIAEHRREPAPQDVLSTFMQAKDETGAGMTDIELHDEVMTLFFAAYEDIANIIAWTWYLLAQNPDAEERLRAEVESAIGQHSPTAADLRNLPYLAMLVDEVLRLYPVSWSLLRDVIEDDEIGGFHIPAGSMILMDLYLTHRLPEYWNDPEKFDPERFSPERSVGRPRFAYFPFGGGPRQCIGKDLALMAIRLILIRMVQQYRFTVVTQTPIQMNALSSLQPRGGVWVKVNYK
jgi:cytochrome P450